MEQFILETIDIVQKAGLTGLLIILAIPKLRKAVFGNGNNGNMMCEQVKDLQSHAEIANHEMGEVKERLIALEIKVDLLLKHFKL